jgi:hypothetical protein
LHWNYREIKAFGARGKTIYIDFFVSIKYLNHMGNR